MISKEEVRYFLAKHEGRQHGITAVRLVSEITNAPPTTAAMRIMRKRVEELRLEGVPVCSTPSTGYFISHDEGEINRTCEFLHSRAMTSLTQVSALKKVALPDLRKQLGLPIEEEKECEPA